MAWGPINADNFSPRFKTINTKQKIVDPKTMLPFILRTELPDIMIYDNPKSASPGTFIAVHPTPKSSVQLYNWCLENGIKKIIHANRMHCTLVTTAADIQIPSHTYETMVTVPLSIRPPEQKQQVVLLQSAVTPSMRRIILRIYSPELTKRRIEIEDKYKILNRANKNLHITLSLLGAEWNPRKVTPLPPYLEFNYEEVLSKTSFYEDM